MKCTENIYRVDFPPKPPCFPSHPSYDSFLLPVSTPPCVTTLRPTRPTMPKPPSPLEPPTWPSIPFPPTSPVSPVTPVTPLLPPYLDILPVPGAPPALPLPLPSEVVAILTRVAVETTFPSSEEQNNISATGDQYTTELFIEPFLPSYAVISNVHLVASVTALNNSATLQKIGIQVQGRPEGGTWVSYFSQANCIGLPANEGSTMSYVAVSSLSIGLAKYGFRIRVNQSSANSVLYTIQFALVYTYIQKIPTTTP